MSKHLTLSDRAIIEKYLAQDMSFSYIAKRLDRAKAEFKYIDKYNYVLVNDTVVFFFQASPKKYGSMY